MSLGLGLFLIGLAIFFGAFVGILVMGIFCSNLRAERDAWRAKYDKYLEKYVLLNADHEKVQDKYKLLLDDFKKQMQK